MLPPRALPAGRRAPEPDPVVLSTPIDSMRVLAIALLTGSLWALPVAAAERSILLLTPTATDDRLDPSHAAIGYWNDMLADSPAERWRRGWADTAGRRTGACRPAESPDDSRAGNMMVRGRRRLVLS